MYQSTKRRHLRRIPLKGTFKYFWTVFLSIMLASAAFAQGDQGRIAGKVKDASGAVIPGVTLVVTNDRTGEERKTLSGDTGDYLFAALRPSEYTVKVTLPGFAPAERKAIQLVIGQALN